MQSNKMLRNPKSSRNPSRLTPVETPTTSSPTTTVTQDENNENSAEPTPTNNNSLVDAVKNAMNESFSDLTIDGRNENADDNDVGSTKMDNNNTSQTAKPESNIDETNSDQKSEPVKPPVLPWAKLAGIAKITCLLDEWDKWRNQDQDSRDQEYCVKILKETSQFYWREKDLRDEASELLVDRKWAETSHEQLKAMTRVGLFSSDPVWFSAYYVLNAMWNYSDCSLKFAKVLHDADVLTTMKSYMTHKPFIDALSSSKNIFYVVKASLSITHNVSRAPDVVATFKLLGMPEAVSAFLRENYTSDEFIQAVSGLILANISEDGDDLSHTEKIIDFIVSCMKKAQEHVKGRFRGFTPTELAHGLAKLTATDANKLKIVEAGALPVFNNMLGSGDDEECLSAASALWGLAFDQDARRRIQEEPKLMDNLEALLHHRRDDVRKAARGAVWTVKQKLEQREHTDKASDHKEALIFLSYSWGNQEMTLRIHQELVKLGYKVWIDVEQMSENLLESMAEGIEAANLVIMCVSETYKDSPNCRTEAEYSYKLSKPIIPVMMQNNFRATGWLGLILGTKFYYNFAKIEFEEIFPQFHREVINKLGGRQQPERIVPVKSAPVSSASAVATAPPSGKGELYSWTGDQVKTWLALHKLDGYWSSLSDLDGKSLVSMHQLKSEAPEYFYRLLESTVHFSLADLLTFRAELSKLVHDKG